MFQVGKEETQKEFFYYKSTGRSEAKTMICKGHLSICLVILMITLVFSANVIAIGTMLEKDLAYAKEYLNYIESANLISNYQEAKKDLDMAVTLASRIKQDGENNIRLARIKLEEFWQKASLKPPAATRLAYLNADEITRKALAKDLKSMLKEIADLGFNGVIVETFRADGYAIFPSSRIEQYKLLQGSDPLKEISRYGKELGLDLFLIMNVGLATSNGEMAPTLAKNPDWAAISQAGNLFDTSMNSYFNISHPEVRKFYMDVADELSEYKLSGLLLKIMLPFTEVSANDFSYDAYSRKLFEEQYGYDPLKEKNKPRVDWNEWRVEQINSLLGLINRRLGSAKTSTKLGAMVMLDDDLSLDDLRDRKLLDWKSWIERNYIEYLFPTFSTLGQINLLNEELTSIPNKVFVYPALLVNEEISVCDLLCTVNEMQSTGAVVLGSLEELDYNQLDMLRRGPLREKSLPLHRDPWQALLANSSLLETQSPKTWVNDIKLLNDSLSKLLMAPQGIVYIDALANVKSLLNQLDAKAQIQDTPFARRMEKEIMMTQRLLELGTLRRTPQGKKLY